MRRAVSYSFQRSPAAIIIHSTAAHSFRAPNCGLMSLVMPARSRWWRGCRPRQGQAGTTVGARDAPPPPSRQLSYAQPEEIESDPLFALKA
jgi:hypothetical protein